MQKKEPLFAAVLTLLVAVAPAFRGRGIAGAYYDHVRPGLAAEGYASIVAAVKHDNEPSLRMHRKVGFRTLGRLWDARLGPFRRTMLGPRTAATLGARSRACD